MIHVLYCLAVCTNALNTLDTELLSDNNCSLLSNQQGSGVRVRPNVCRRDGEVGNLQVLDTVDVQVRVNDSTLFAWLHGASSELQTFI